ncbi:MAG: M23 family metallopeptidase [Mycobacterium sp.]
MLTPVTGSVVAAPIPVPGTDGRIHLAYEVDLVNRMPDEVTITSLAVLAGDTALLSLSGDQLSSWMRVAGNPTNKLGPGQAGIVWLDVAVDRPADGPEPAIPANLIHAVGIEAAKPNPPLVPATMTETIAPTEVSTGEPVVISAPLRGPNWLNGDGCCGLSAHRGALNPINGQLWAAERFAIDYVQLNEQDQVLVGAQDQLQSYAYFGSDIHAVGAGPVVAVVDNLPEQVPGASPTGLTLDQYGGNHIVQDLGNGNYAFYAHLQPGSVKVKVGDQLGTGQVIASLGNSGNTDAPHLHFHLMSTPDPLRSNGLPFVINSFELTGRLASEAALNQLLGGTPAELAPGFTAQTQTNVSPLDLDIMRYS